MQDDQNLDTSQDDIMASFREERLEQRRKKPAILIGVSIGVVLAVAIGGLTYGRYVSVYYDADSGNLPVIRADSSVDGMKPATPGGMEVPNRDKLVYERLRQSNTEVPVERLLPISEKPHVPAVEKEEKKEDRKVAQPDAEEDPIAVLAAGIIEQKQSSALIYEEDGTPVEVMFKEPSSDSVKLETVKKEPVIKEKPKKEEAKPDEAKEFFSVQLVSTRSESAAESEWKRLSKKFNEIIASQPYHVSKTVVASGTFYRLRVGRFEKRDQAVALCDQLKEKKQECFVVK